MHGICSWNSPSFQLDLVSLRQRVLAHPKVLAALDTPGLYKGKTKKFSGGTGHIRALAREAVWGDLFRFGDTLQA